ncbi:hypothetical protein N205_08415 [Helicobacter pylori UM077]|nr:hypothetical protein N205_08415 [Helicobacter pylori UM077]
MKCSIKLLKRAVFKFEKIVVKQTPHKCGYGDKF